MKKQTEKESATVEKTPKKKTVFIPRRFKGDDVRTVSVNGRYLRIPTGRQFEVDPEFAEVVFNAGLADEYAEKHREELSRG